MLKYNVMINIKKIQILINHVLYSVLYEMNMKYTDDT